MLESSPVRVFVSYAREDSAHAEQLCQHLAPMLESGRIELWLDQQIVGGDDWEARIRDALERAEIVVLLVSSDFLSSQFIKTVELPIAMTRHASGATSVVPVRLRPVDLAGTQFERLQQLPGDGHWVVQGRDPDAAFLEVVVGLREVVSQRLRAREGGVAPRAVPARVRSRWRRVAVAAALGVSLLVWLLWYVAALDLVFLDTRLMRILIDAGAPAATLDLPEAVTVIGIGDDDVCELGDDAVAWRRCHAALVRALVEHRPGVIALDFEYREPSDADDELAQAIEAALAAGVRVVLGVAHSESGRPSLSERLARTGASRGWLCIASAANLLFYAPLAMFDRDATPQWTPGLALAAVAAHRGLDRFSIETRELTVILDAPTGEFDSVSFRYPSPRRQLYHECGPGGARHGTPSIVLALWDREALERRTVPLADARRRLAGEAGPPGDSWPAGAIVLVGNTRREGVVDRLTIADPFAGDHARFGVWMHADAVATLLAGVDIRPVEGPLAQLAILLVAVAAGMSLSSGARGRRWPLVLSLVGGPLLYGGIALIVYTEFQLVTNAGYDLLAFFAAATIGAMLKRRYLA